MDAGYKDFAGYKAYEILDACARSVGMDYAIVMKHAMIDSFATGYSVMFVKKKKKTTQEIRHLLQLDESGMRKGWTFGSRALDDACLEVGLPMARCKREVELEEALASMERCKVEFGVSGHDGVKWWMLIKKGWTLEELVIKLQVGGWLEAR